MSAALHAAAWPMERLGEALETLGQSAGYRPRALPLRPEVPPADVSDESLDRWIQSTARWLEVEAEPVETSYTELDSLLRGGAPAVIRLAAGADVRFIAVLRARSERLTLVTPDRRVQRVGVQEVRAALCGEQIAPVAADVDRLLEEAGIPPGQRRRTREHLVRERLSATPVGGCWLVRPGSGASPLIHLGGRRLLARAGKLLGAHAVQHALFILAWWLMGWMALTDRFDLGWLALWVLLFGVLLTLRMYVFTAGGHLSIEVSSYLKQQLLQGAFRLHPDEVRRQGAGQLLGRTMEVEAIESFTFMGALVTVTAAIELLFAGLILGVGAGGGVHALLLALWTGLMIGAASVYYHRRSRWTEARLDLTNGLVEQMVGHRTRAVQEPRHRWNQDEDRSLESYHRVADRQDRGEVVLDALIPRGWFLVGMGALVPAFVAGGHSVAAVAAGIGGVLLGQRAFKGLSAGIEQLVGAAVAWQRIRPLLEARRRAEPVGLPVVATPAGPAADELPSVRPLLDVRGLGFQYPGRSESTLENADLDVYLGDRILLEGPSGGGKSTLARLLAAFDRPRSGVLLLEGMDPATLGVHEWRRRVVFVPQFHDNHVLMGSFAYNLLMGRNWPPTTAELREAESVCRALGLGPLLDRMPGGLFQMVGETGWQLSHGERSRLFLARAILQKPDMMILDESFAALDPQTLASVQSTVLTSDSAILLIAHP